MLLASPLPCTYTCIIGNLFSLSSTDTQKKTIFAAEKMYVECFLKSLGLFKDKSSVDIR
jgi:hypothetical protein